jgi:DNA end-binding protein Ku
MTVAATWKGAIEFSGFPVNVALHNRTKSRGSESFKTLAPNGQPVKSQYIDTEGNVVERDSTSKGYEVAKGQFAVLSPEALEAIGSGQRSTLVEPDSFAPLGSVPLELALATYSVTADAKVAGSEKSVNVLWNGLRKTGLAYVTRVTLSSRDAILVVWATDDALLAAALPFTTELNEVPSATLTENEAEAEMFESVVGAAYETRPFDHKSFESEYGARRRETIEAVLKGHKVEAPAEPAPAAEVPDLMAALKAAQAKAGGKPAKKPAKKAAKKVAA